MKKNSLFIICFVLMLTGIAVHAQDTKVVLPPKYQVDTRIDNMGYWQACAALGLVPVQPATKIPPAVYLGTKVFNNRGVMITDSPDVPTTTQTSTQSENSLNVDPNNKNHMLNSNNSTPQPSTGSIYGADWLDSGDGGLTWGGSIQGPGGGNSGDPAACINLSGRYFVGYIDNAYGQSVSYSDNQGSTWSVVKVGTGSMLNMLDKNHLWVDNSPTSPFKGNLYDGWMYSNQINISYSNTNGTSWSAPKAISSGTAAGSHNQGENFKTGPNGEVYCLWAVYDSWPSDEKALGFSKSLDGGVTWTTAVRAINNIRGTRTTGVTQNMRTNSFPSMTVDLSNGPNRGTIYAVWPNIGVPGVNTGNDVDVYMIKSTDQGATWSTPSKVNQDASGLGKKHYLSWIACDPTSGQLVVVFYDNRNVASNMAETWMAWSQDAGATWQDMRVSDVSFTPSPIPNMASQYMGDYLGIDIYGGMAYPCWTDTRSGHCMTYVSPIALLIPQATVVYDANILNDTTYGNGNGKMDINETELLGLKVKNTGDGSGDSITVRLSSPAPYITFSDSTEFYGNIPSGGSKTIMNAFKYSTSNSMPGMQLIPFVVEAIDKYDSITTSTFNILSHGPAITINALSVDDQASGNNNGRLDPGETVILNIQTQNTGDYPLSNVVSHLTSPSPYITILDPDFTIANLAAGETTIASFHVKVSSAAYIGSAALFHNTASSQYLTAQKDFLLKIGLIVEDWETGNFTKFAWQAYGDAPWTIDPTVK
jgi:hypothetical protein